MSKKQIEYSELTGNPELNLLVENWFYVSKFKGFVRKDKPLGDVLSEKEFDNSYKYLEKYTPNVRKNNTTRAATASEYLIEFHNITNVISYVCSKPNEAEIFTDPQTKLRTINLWRPPQIEPVKGDVSIFEEYILYLMDNKPEQADFFMKFLAHCVRHPGKKIYWMPVLSSNERGLGKNLLTDHIMATLVGKTCWSRLDNPNYITGNHDEWKLGATFVVLDEVLQSGSRKFLERLKPLITSEVTKVNPKGLKPFDIANNINFIALSNHMNAIQIDEEERRFFVVHNRQLKKSREWFLNFNKWLDNGGFEHIYHYFLNEVDLSDFDRRSPPLKTNDFHTAAEFNKKDASIYVKEMINSNSAPFGPRDLFTMSYIKQHIKSALPLRNAGLQDYMIQNALQANGIETVGRITIPYKEGRKVFSTFGDVDKIKSIHKEWLKSPDSSLGLMYYDVDWADTDEDDY